MWTWIAGFPLSGQAGPRKALQVDEGAGRRRIRCDFSAQHKALLRHRLSNAGLCHDEDIFGEVHDRSQLQTWLLCGIVSIDPSDTYDALSPHWNEEARCMHQFWHHPDDAYLAAVKEAYAIDGEDVPVRFESHAQSSGGLRKVACSRSCIIQPHLHAGMLLSLQLKKDGHQQVCSAHLLRGHPAAAESSAAEGAPDLEFKMPPCIGLPLPIARLVVSGQWPSLMLLGRWHPKTWMQGKKRQRFPSYDTLFPGFPTQHWLREHDSKHQALADMPMGLDDIGRMLDHVRQWAPCWNKAGGSPESVDALRQHVQVLESWMRQLHCATATLHEKHSRTFSCDKLVRALQLSWNVRGGGKKCLEVVSLSLRSVLPPDLAESLIQRAQARSVLPGRSTLQRSRFSLDLALTLARQQWSASCGSVNRYLLADSSPQVGRNWLWVMEITIERSVIIHLCISACRLATAVADVVQQYRAAAQNDGDGDDALLQELAGDWQMAEDCCFLQEHVHAFTHIPVALGGREAGAVQEARALCHALALEHPSREALGEVLGQIYGCCTDMGTELGLSELAVSAAEVIPTWRLGPSNLESGVNSDLAAGSGSDGGALTPCGSMRLCGSDTDEGPRCAGIDSGARAKARVKFLK